MYIFYVIINYIWVDIKILFQDENLDLDTFGKKKKKKKKDRGGDVDMDDANDGENKENGKLILQNTLIR